MVIFNHLPRKHLLRVLLHSRSWSRERQCEKPLLTSPNLHPLHLCCSTHPENKREDRREQSPEGQPSAPSPFCARAQGNGQQVHPVPANCWSAGPTACPVKSPSSAPRRFSQVCSWAPSYGTSFPVSHRPFHVSAVWPGPPRSEGRQGKGEVTQAQANSSLYIWRGGRYCQYMCKVVPNFTIRKVIFRALRKYSLQHSLPWALSHLPCKYLISLGCCLLLLLMKYLVGNIPDYMDIQG